MPKDYNYKIIAGGSYQLQFCNKRIGSLFIEAISSMVLKSIFYQHLALVLQMIDICVSLLIYFELKLDQMCLSDTSLYRITTIYSDQILNSIML